MMAYIDEQCSNLQLVMYGIYYHLESNMAAILDQVEIYEATGSFSIPKTPGTIVQIFEFVFRAI